jgi:hypothetical protein
MATRRFNEPIEPMDLANMRELGVQPRPGLANG